MTRQTSPSDSVMMLDTMIECLVVNYVFSGLVVVFLLLYSTPAPIEVIFTTSLFIVVVIKCEEERKQSARNGTPNQPPPPKKKKLKTRSHALNGHRRNWWSHSVKHLFYFRRRRCLIIFQFPSLCI